MEERIAWADAERINRQAHRYVRDGHTDAWWRLVLSVPLADGVRLVRRSAGLRPAAPSSGSLLARLAGADENLVSRVAATAARDSCELHANVATSAQWVSFGIDGTVLMVAVEPDRSTRVAMWRDRAWRNVYHGALEHEAAACIDAYNVVAVRDDPTHGRVLVHYASESERPVVRGDVVIGMRPVATADGFVAGSALQGAAMVAGPNRRPEILDLSPFGLLTAHRLAVSPTGDAVAFAGNDRIVLTDARMEYLVASAVVPAPHQPVLGVTFTGPNEVVAVGATGGLSRWRTEPHEALVLKAVGPSPRLSGLVHIPAWGVVGGRDNFAAEHRFFDPVSLDPVDPPRPFTEARYDPRLVQSISASADGRFAAVSGQLHARSPKRSYDFLLAVYDFAHPLAPVLRPVASLHDGDLTAVRAAALNSVRHTAEQRQVLGLLAEVVEHRLQVG